MMNKIQACIDIDVHDCAVELYLNGIPLLHYGDAPGLRRTSVPVDPYMQNGRNLVQVILAPGSTPADAKAPGGRLSSKAAVRVRLYQRTLGSIEPAGEVVHATLTWPPQGSVAAPRLGPVELRTDASIDWPVAPEGWAWQRAEPLSVYRLADDVAHILHRLHGDLSQGRTDGMIALHHWKIQDFARAFGLDAQTQRREMRDQLTSLLARPGFALDPLSRHRLSLRRVADNHLVDVLCDDWHPPIRAGTYPRPDWFAVRLRLGKVGGVWGVLC